MRRNRWHSSRPCATNHTHPGRGERRSLLCPRSALRSIAGEPGGARNDTVRFCVGMGVGSAGRGDRFSPRQPLHRRESFSTSPAPPLYPQCAHWGVFGSVVSSSVPRGSQGKRKSGNSRKNANSLRVMVRYPSLSRPSWSQTSPLGAPMEKAAAWLCLHDLSLGGRFLPGCDHSSARCR